MPYCKTCGREHGEESEVCTGCGESLIKKESIEPNSEQSHRPRERPMEWKSEGTTLILTIVLGILGFGGIGHMYLGQIGKGIGILIGGIILFVLVIATWGVALIAFIPFVIWVVYDARKQCKIYNNHLEKTGEKPW